MIAMLFCAETTVRDPDKKPDTTHAGKQVENAEFVGNKVVHRLHQFVDGADGKNPPFSGWWEEEL